MLIQGSKWNQLKNTPVGAQKTEYHRCEIKPEYMQKLSFGLGV